MGRDAAEKWVFGLEMVVFGLPTLGVATPLLLLGILVAVGGLATSAVQALPVVALVGGGVAGLLAWFVLGITYLTGDARELRDMHWGWWVALAAGVLASSPFLVLSLEHPGRDLWQLLCGPALVLPALHLAWLRWRHRGRVNAN